jgi:hypothetical protein
MAIPAMCASISTGSADLRALNNWFLFHFTTNSWVHEIHRPAWLMCSWNSWLLVLMYSRNSSICLCLCVHEIHFTCTYVFMKFITLLVLICSWNSLCLYLRVHAIHRSVCDYVFIKSIATCAHVHMKFITLPVFACSWNSSLCLWLCVHKIHRYLCSCVDEIQTVIKMRNSCVTDIASLKPHDFNSSSNLCAYSCSWNPQLHGGGQKYPPPPPPSTHWMGGWVDPRADPDDNV